MPQPFLEVFPREIRDQIYTFVLASQDGTVNLSPWTIEVARSLSILRTCRQIHRECKDIIWSHTGLSLRETSQLSEKLQTLGKHRQVRRIRQLKLCLELLDRDELEWICKSMIPLLEWCRVGRLEAITLSASWDKPCGVEEFKEILNLRKYGQSLDGRLYLDSSTWTRMVMNTGWPRFTHWGKQRWLREMLLDSTGTAEILKEIHSLFGGQLLVDGHLYFKDGKQVGNNLLDPREGEIKIIPAINALIMNRANT